MKFLALFILVALPMTGLGLKCLECTFASSSNTLTDRTCVDGDIKNSVECTQETDWPQYPIDKKDFRSKLRKPNSTVTEGRQWEFTCLEIYGYVFKTEVTERGCGFKEPNRCIEINKPDEGERRKFCACDTDNCNNSKGGASSNITGYPVFVLLSTLIISIQSVGKW